MCSHPQPLTDAVSRRLARMPRRDTGPELALRRELHSRGLRYRVGLRGLPGTPDLAFTRAKIAVFVDGCFWHGCPDHCIPPTNNADWWREKFAANQSRDRRKDAELVQLGWQPVHVWEHEHVTAAADRIRQLWRERIA